MFGDNTGVIELCLHFVLYRMYAVSVAQQSFLTLTIIFCYYRGQLSYQPLTDALVGVHVQRTCTVCVEVLE